jgi:hypothetical protein
VTVATALHAEPLDELHDMYSGPHDMTGLFVMPDDEKTCEPLITRSSIAPNLYRIACDEAEARYYDELHVRHVRYLLGDPGRH